MVGAMRLAHSGGWRQRARSGDRPERWPGSVRRPAWAVG